MNSVNPSIDRRRLLRNGTLALSMGAIVAACGSNRGGVEAPGRLGIADAESETRDTTVDDVVLLRTAQSLEHTTVAVHEAAIASGALDDATAALAARFVDDHVANAAAIGELITAAGGAEFACANPFVVERAVDPILAALEGSDDPRRDVLHIAYAFEELLGRSHQALVTLVSDRPLRAEISRIGGSSHRRAAALAAVMNPGALVEPTLAGDEALDADAMGFPMRYAIPSSFGQLTGISLIVGDVDEEGARYSTTLQTPAANTLVYADQSC